MANKEKRAVIVTDVEAGTLAFHEPVENTTGKGNKWTPGRLIRTVAMADYPADILRMATLTVGLRNKFMDTYADKTKDIATQLAKMHDQLVAGTWEAAGETTERNTLFIEAWATALGKPIDTVRAFVNAASANEDEKKLAVINAARANATVQAHMARIQKERAAQREKDAKAAAKQTDAIVPDFEAAA